MILLIGSSILKNWRHLSKICQQNNYHIINNAVGGSTTDYQLYSIDDLIIPYNPSVIIWYCGSNDINNNTQVYKILLNTIKWVNKVSYIYPNCKILLLSIIKAPQKYIDNHIYNIDLINTFIMKKISHHKNVIYIDINKYLCFDNQPILNYYKKDNLHLKNSTYKLLSNIILDYIILQTM